jgi:two-component system chemotaxis response regulator CheB
MNSETGVATIEAIVIGASAGGVEALFNILGPLREGFVLPIIVVLHLPDERRSQLAEVFARRVALPVLEALDKTPVEPGTLYFAAPGYHLSVEQDRSFSLSQEDRVHHSRPAIDYLFESAADAYGPTLAAVLLTGANQDGARG